MRVEIPQLKRCCFCLPLRRGIIAFGYATLVFTIFMIVVLFIVVHHHGSSSAGSMYRGVSLYMDAWFPAILLFCDVIFNIVLIAGAHMNNLLMLQVYYYYGIMTTFASFVVALLVRGQEDSWMFLIIELGFMFCGIVLQLYLLLLIYNYMDKCKHREQHNYVNHLSEVTLESRHENGRNLL